MFFFKHDLVWLGRQAEFGWLGKTRWRCNRGGSMRGRRGWALPILLGAVGCQVAPEQGAPEQGALSDARSLETPVAVPSDRASPSAAKTLQEIGCTFPVKANDTGASLLARYGDQARREEVAGAEGEVLEAIILWADDPDRKIEVYFNDAGMTERSSLRLADSASAWTISGLSKGAPINRVEQENGRAFDLLGFEWDYSGNVIDWNGGKLERLSGGCRAGARLAPAGLDEVLPDELLGDREIRSDLPALRKVDPVVTDLWITFPDTRDRGP